MASRQRSRKSFTRLVVHRDDEVSTTKDEVTGFVECIDDNKSFTLYECVKGFSSGGKSASGKRDSPAYLAAEWGCGRAGAMPLRQPETKSILAPVCGEASGSCFVKDLYPLVDFTDDEGFGLLKETFKLICPLEAGVFLGSRGMAASVQLRRRCTRTC